MNPSIEATRLHYFLPRQKTLKTVVIASGVITILATLLLLLTWNSSLPSRIGYPFIATGIIILFFVIIILSTRSNNAIHDQLTREIEERKRAQEEAHSSNLFVNAIYENIPNMVFVKGGEELRYKSINKAGEDLIGFTREELLGRCDHDFFPKEEADFFRARDKEVFATTYPVIAEEPITTSAHGVRWVRTKKIGVRDENGRPLYMIGISE